MSVESLADQKTVEQRAFAPWVLGLSAVLCLTLLPTASYAAAIPLIRTEWDLSATQAGFIFSTYQIGYVGATLLLLPLTDRFDARWVLLVSAALSALGNAFFPLWAHDFVSGSILRFIAGIALVGVYMPGTRIVAEQFSPQHRGGPVGLYVASFYLGTNLSVLLTGLLLPSLGWRGAFLAAAAVSVLAPFIAWLSLRQRATKPTKRGSAHLDPGVLANRPTLLVIGSYAAHCWELYAARGWIAPFMAAVLVGQGYADTEATSFGATLSGIAFGVGALSVFGAGFLSDRFGRTMTAGAFLAGSAICSLSIGFLGSFPIWALFVVALFYGLLIGGDSPIYTTAVTEMAAPGKLGSAMAMQSFLGFLVTIVSPVALGAALDLAGPTFGWGLGFAQSGVIALLGVASLIALRRHASSRVLANGRR